MMGEKFENFEGKERERTYPYDAVIVLGVGLMRRGEGSDAKYYPTDYRHGDDFGMLGAGMRMVAVIEFYLEGKAKNIVFSTGVTEKNKEKFGADVPTEASVYEKKFLRVLEGLRHREDYKDRFKDLEKPVIELEDKSFNTMSNVKEVLGMIQEKQWEKIVIISSDYHMPRVKALWDKVLESRGDSKLSIEFISAESFIKENKPGAYDRVIDEYYASPEAEKRIKNEAKGVEDLKKKQYFPGEFQLRDKEQKD